MCAIPRRKPTATETSKSEVEHNTYSVPQNASSTHYANLSWLSRTPYSSWTAPSPITTKPNGIPAEYAWHSVNGVQCTVKYHFGVQNVYENGLPYPIQGEGRTTTSCSRLRRPQPT